MRREFFGHFFSNPPCSRYDFLTQSPLVCWLRIKIYTKLCEKLLPDWTADLSAMFMCLYWLGLVLDLLPFVLAWTLVSPNGLLVLSEICRNNVCAVLICLWDYGAMDTRSQKIIQRSQDRLEFIWIWSGWCGDGWKFINTNLHLIKLWSFQTKQDLRCSGTR